MPKCLLLFNGGIDSITAAKFLQMNEQDVILLNFESKFFGGESERIKQISRQLKLPVLIVDITQQQVALTANPVKQYGSGANPCVDCRANMLQVAYQLMPKYGCDYIATGDVLKQHLISQSIEAFAQAQKMAGIPDIVLRPLCGKLLPENIVTQKYISRNTLLSYQGQSHKDQETFMRTNRIAIKTPLKSCQLLDHFYSKKLICLKQDGLLHSKLQFLQDMVSFGRLFRFGYRQLLVLYRKHECAQFKQMNLQNVFTIENEENESQQTLVAAVDLQQLEIEAEKPMKYEYDIEEVKLSKCTKLGQKTNQIQITKTDLNEMLQDFVFTVFGSYSKLNKGVVGDKTVCFETKEDAAEIIEQKMIK
ncbi:TRNA_(5-methylaminomethyl-2-thiouridylate)-methyltransferase [Hexamita inflata]|uniref:tRNA_(5-methylaminomethyl-2-thiouridylate)-methyl transferase n=1 Tax=Hexamita inflata TaxID=28002 RepID=A0ABP1HJ78_9EUKA